MYILTISHLGWLQEKAGISFFENMYKV